MYALISCLYIYAYIYVCHAACIYICVLYVCMLEFHAYIESMLEFHACILYLSYILSLVNISLSLWQHIGHLL